MTSVVVRNVSLADSWLETLRDPRRGNTKPLTLNEDPLALSWASYRHWIMGGGRWPSFDILEVQDVDRRQGQAMRSYYRGRLTWQQLKNRHELSSFRSRLAALLIDQEPLVEGDLGILYRLPYFWIEDQAHDRVFANRPVLSVLPVKHQDIETQLTLIETVLVSRRSRERIQFWFESDTGSVPVMLTVTEDNPLKTLLISLLDRGPVALRATLQPVHMRGYHREHVYYDLKNPRLQ